MKKVFFMGALIASTISVFADFPIVVPTPVQKIVVAKAVEQAKTYTDKAVQGVSSNVVEAAAKAEAAAAKAEGVSGQIETLSNDIAAAVAKVDGVASQVDVLGNDVETATATAETARSNAAKANEKLTGISGTVADAIATAKNEAIESSGNAADEKISAKTTSLSNNVEELKTQTATGITALDNRLTSAEGSIESLGTFSMMAMPKTSYLVYANDAVIPVGPCEALGGDVTVEIPVGMTEAIIIRSTYKKDNIDVFIDWGDGSAVSSCKDVDPVVADIDDNRYTMEHTYTAAGKYRVTIYGYRYVTLMHSQADSSKNLLCSCFGIEDEIAPNIDNVASFAYNCPRLVSLKVNGWRMFLIRNISNTFNGCQNLTSITYCAPQDICRSSDSIFKNCVNLKTTDFRLSQNLSNPQSIMRTFYGCGNLEVDINTLLPKGGFSAPVIDVNSLFYGCAKLTGTVPADMLWGNTKIKWLNTTNCFSGCSDAIRAQVPVSWGGTKAE